MCIVRTTNFWAPCLTAIVGRSFATVQLAGEEGELTASSVVAF